MSATGTGAVELGRVNVPKIVPLEVTSEMSDSAGRTAPGTAVTAKVHAEVRKNVERFLLFSYRPRAFRVSLRYLEHRFAVRPCPKHRAVREARAVQRVSVEHDKIRRVARREEPGFPLGVHK
jgi:hypothetical protein